MPYRGGLLIMDYGGTLVDGHQMENGNSFTAIQ